MRNRAKQLPTCGQTLKQSKTLRCDRNYSTWLAVAAAIAAIAVLAVAITVLAIAIAAIIAVAIAAIAVLAEALRYKSAYNWHMSMML